MSTVFKVMDWSNSPLGYPISLTSAMANMNDVNIGETKASSARGRHGLRRVKLFPTSLLTEYRRNASYNGAELSSGVCNSGGETAPGLLRIWLRAPWDHYTPVLPLSTGGGAALVYRRGVYFQQASIKVFPYPRSVSVLQRLSHVRHANIARIFDAYCHEEKLFIAEEYLGVSLSDLDFHRFLLEEWEIATILAEVCEALLIDVIEKD